MNYTDLKAAIDGADGYAHAGNISSKMDTFIALFEARANRKLRCLEMEETYSVTPVNEFITMPSDFLELRHIRINGATPTILQWADVQEIERHTSGSSPAYFTWLDNKFKIAPSAAGSSVDVLYYEKIPALSDSNQTNWLLDKYPDYYISGVLSEYYLYSQDPLYAESQMRLNEQEAFINAKGSKLAYGRGPLCVSSDISSTFIR